MAEHELIDRYLCRLARHLPGATVAELENGLAAAYHRHRGAGLAPQRAAAAAIAEYGPADAILRGYVRRAPGRRVALALLCSGPLVGLSWATTLAVSHAWTWPVPGVLRVALGAVLLGAIAALALAVTARRSYRRTRLGAAGSLAMMILDACVLTVVAVVAPPFVWPLAVAVPASLTRVALIARVLPRLLAPA